MNEYAHQMHGPRTVSELCISQAPPDRAVARAAPPRARPRFYTRKVGDTYLWKWVQQLVAPGPDPATVTP